MIRPALVSDAAGIAALICRERRSGRALFLEVPESESGLKTWLKENDGQFPALVSERAGQLAGFAFAKPVCKAGPMRYLACGGLVLQPGISDAERDKLTGLLESALRQMNMLWLITPLADDDRNGLSFLASRGYQPVGHLKKAGLTNGVWKSAVWLARELTVAERIILDRKEPVTFDATELGKGLRKR